jgi:hypothetical protein
MVSFTPWRLHPKGRALGISWLVGWWATSSVTQNCSVFFDLILRGQFSSSKRNVRVCVFYTETWMLLYFAQLKNYHNEDADTANRAPRRLSGTQLSVVWIVRDLRLSVICNCKVSCRGALEAAEIHYFIENQNDVFIMTFYKFVCT